MTKKHTPGPWRVGSFKTLHTSVDHVYSDKSKEPEEGIVRCYQWVGKEEALANARLVAAAPELLEALEGMLTLQDPNGRFAPSWHKPFLQKAVNAVKKAKGEQ